MPLCALPLVFGPHRWCRPHGVAGRCLAWTVRAPSWEPTIFPTLRSGLGNDGQPPEPGANRYRYGYTHPHISGSTQRCDIFNSV